MTNNNTYNKIILTKHIKDRLQERNVNPAIIGESLQTYIETKKVNMHNNKNVMLINKKANTSILIEVLIDKIRLITVINKLAWTKKELSATLEIAKSDKKLPEDLLIFMGFGLKDFDKIYVTLETEELNSLAYHSRQKFMVI